MLLKKKALRKSLVSARKGITGAISKKWLVDIIRTKKLLESPGALFDRVSEPVKPKIKRQEIEKVDFWYF